MNARLGTHLATCCTLALASILAGCSGETAIASIQGRLGAGASEATAQAGQALSTPHSGEGIGTMKRPLVVDSAETSLEGITLELVEWRPNPDWSEVGVVGSVAPDATGAFAFTDVPVMSHMPPNNGRYHVNIIQPTDAAVPYGGGGFINWLREGEVLPLSLPVVTRLHLPLWPNPDDPAPPEQGFPNVQLAAASDSRLIYFSPHLALGIYDPTQSTVDTLRAASALDFPRPNSRVNFIAQTDQVIISLVGDHLTPARFLLIDLDIFTDASVSESLDLDDPTTAAQLADRVTLIDLPVPADLPNPPARQHADPALRIKSVVTADGKRFYQAEDNNTFVIDLETRTCVDAWHDGAHLAAYNAQAGHLYLDVPGGTLRVRDASTGALVHDLDIGARFLLGIAPLPDAPRTLVSYESALTPRQHRIAIIGADGTVQSDHLAGDYLGFIDRLWDEAYEWGNCGPEFWKGDECPECDDPPTDLPFPEGMETLHNVDMFFDGPNNQLVMPHFGAAFELRDGLLYPMPYLMCSRFGMPDECTGHAFYDSPNQVAVVQSLYEPSTTCVMHTDGSDLTIPVKIAGGHSGFSRPVVLPSLGTGFVASDQALTAIHYNNPDAASQPAVRDLRSEITSPK